MCVIRVVVIHAGRRQNQRIDEKIKSLVKYIAGISDARATDSPIYQLLEVIQFTHTLSNEKVEMLHQQTDFNENLKSESKRSSTGRYRTPTKSRLFKPLRPSLAKKKSRSCRLRRFDAGLPVSESISSDDRPDRIAAQIFEANRHDPGTIWLRVESCGTERRGDQGIAGIDRHSWSFQRNQWYFGRIYKDKYVSANKSNSYKAAGFFDQAIGAYLAVFKADISDFHPGVNARGPQKSRLC